MDFFADNAPLIRLIVIIIAIVLLGGRMFWREFQAKSEALLHQDKYPLSRRFESVVALSREFQPREFLFGDHTVEQHIKGFYTQEPQRDNFNSSLDYFFALNSYHTLKGNKLEAKNSLMQVLSLPDADSRSMLVAWKSLRVLGKLPDRTTARQPLGVVIELPAGKMANRRNAVDMIAAYSDGTAEYISQNGKSIEKATPDEDSRLLTTDVLRASEPLIEIAPIFERHQTLHKNVVRMSILTPGGIHVAEAKLAVARTDPAMASLIEAGERLMKALIEGDSKSSLEQ